MIVIHTREGHLPDLSDCPPAKLKRGAPRCGIGDPGPKGRILVRGEYGHDIIDELAPLPDEPVIDKPGKGSFYATDLRRRCWPSRGITTLIVTGVTTEVCVHTTVREANDRGYECLVLADCVGSYFPEFQRVGLEMIAAQGGIFGWVAPSEAFLPRSCSDPAPPCSAPAREEAVVLSRSPVQPRPSSSSPGGSAATPTRSSASASTSWSTSWCSAGLCSAWSRCRRADVFGMILPALGIALLIGNVYYTYLARRLARRENRTDVTAMPYGPQRAAHVHRRLRDHAADLPGDEGPARGLGRPGSPGPSSSAIIVLIGAFVGPYIRKYTPRAAMLGTLAGISIAFISMRPAAQMWEAPWIALPVLVIILIGFFADVKLPRQHPDRPGRAAGRHGDRLDRRLHVGARRHRCGQGHRDRLADACSFGPARRSGLARHRRRCSPRPSRSASTTSPRR